MVHVIACRGRRFGVVGAVASAALLLVLSACSTVPYSERTRVILITESHERELGEQAFQEVLASNDVVSGGERLELIERVGHRIAAVADRVMERDERDLFAWQFVLIDDPKTVNAFAVPGGKVAFYAGIMPICRDELGVAVVMGHEVAHALARHGGERLSQQMVLDAAVAVGAAAISSNEQTRKSVAAALGIGVGIALALPFSREHEYEADYIGLMLMADAGYDPRVAPEFWRRMEALSEGEGGPEWLSTHPAGPDRIARLEANMDEALDRYEAATGESVERYKFTITSE